MQHLYRHFDKSGNLLYVGVSLSTIQRLSQHKNQSHWYNNISQVTIEQFPDRFTALLAERTAIKEENPLHNLSLKVKDPPPIVTEDKKEDSRVHLIDNIVSFAPLYSLDAAASLLDVCILRVKELMEDGKLGYIVYSKVWSKRHNKWQLRRKITGWQLIDFLENMEQDNGSNS